MVLRRHLPESDIEQLITDASGHGSVVVTFDNPLPHTDYVVMLTPQQADGTGIYEVITKLKTGFTIAVTGSEHISTEIINATGNTITFADADPDTITRASGDWTTLFAVGDVITITNSTSNDGSYTIASLTSTVITLVTADTLAAETNTTVTNITFVTDNGADIGWLSNRNS